MYIHVVNKVLPQKDLGSKENGHHVKYSLCKAWIGTNIQQ